MRMLLARRVLPYREVEVLPPPGGILLGVGSDSTSMIDYPPTGPVTVGDMYVATTGDDSNPGTFESPKLTLAAAISAADAGDTILVREGTYTIPTSLRPKANQKIFGYGTERPRLHRSSTPTGTHNNYIFFVQDGGVHIKGFEMAGGINNPDAPHSSLVARFNTSPNSIWEDNIVHSGQTAAVMVNASDNFLFLDSVAIGSSGAGSGTNMPDAFMVSGPVLSNNVRIVRCLGANTGDDITDFYYATNSYVIDSVGISSGRSHVDGSSLGDGNGFKMGGYSGSGPNHVIGSIAVYNRAQGLNHNSTNVAGNTYLNNTSAYNTYGIINDTGGTPANTSRNIVVYNSTYNTSLAGPTSYNTWNLGITNPQFADPANGDFSLLNGSPAIGVAPGGGNLGASTIALELLKKWWNHSQIWVPGRGAGPGGTGLPGDTA